MLTKDRLLDKNMERVPFNPNTQDALKKDQDIMIAQGKSVTTEIDRMGAEYENVEMKKTGPTSTKNLSWDKDF